MSYVNTLSRDIMIWHQQEILDGQRCVSCSIVDIIGRKWVRILIGMFRTVKIASDPEAQVTQPLGSFGHCLYWINHG